MARAAAPTQCLVMAISVSLLQGCLNLRPEPIAEPTPVSPAAPRQSPVTQLKEPQLSGALDGPTLRLALRDLVVILDTLGRLEQVRPDLKPQMLRELADADAMTVASIVQRWRAKLPEFQAAAERARAKDAEIRLAERAVIEPPVPPPAQRPAELQIPAAATADRRDTTPAAESSEVAHSIVATNTDDAGQPLVLETTSQDELPPHPSWNDLIETLLSLTRNQSLDGDSNATRARVQSALLELLQKSHDTSSDAPLPDAQLWAHLAPAVRYCLGGTSADQAELHEVIRSLQVATELLRGPRRFQVRGLSFCSRIRGFGNMDRVDSAAYRPGQAVLLYCEVEHFFSEPEANGSFRTRIGSTLELLDANGNVAWSKEFSAVEDRSNGPRRDYFLSFQFQVPLELQPGLYSVRLTLRDELANRSTAGGIALAVR